MTRAVTRQAQQCCPCRPYNSAAQIVQVAQLWQRDRASSAILRGGLLSG